MNSITDISLETRTCTRCKITKPISEFGMYRSNRAEDLELDIKLPKSRCKQCLVLIAAETYKRPANIQKREKYKEERKEKAKIRMQDWRRGNRDKKFASRLRCKYNLTMDDYISLILKQSNQCAICKMEMTTTRNRCIDHCHRTGKVRGLLCIKCNTGIGQFGDDIKLIENAMKYLQTYA